MANLHTLGLLERTRKNRSTRLLASFVSVVLIFASSTSRIAFGQDANADDFEPPAIEIDEQNLVGAIGGVETFWVTATDDIEVKSVTLHYRYDDFSDYQAEPMESTNDSNYYSANIDTSQAPEGTEFIQYYFRAEDGAGNIALKGYAFDPLVLEFASPINKTVITEVSDRAEPEKKGPNWLLIALGALAVGGLAAAAGGGGGGGGGGTGNNPDCDPCSLNLTIEAPQ